MRRTSPAADPSRRRGGLPAGRRPRRGERGSVTVVVAISLVVLLGFVAMGLDWGAVAVARNQVQTAADAAALAATAHLDDRALATTVAQTYAAQTLVNGRGVQVDDNGAKFGTWDGTTFTETAVNADVVKVTAYADVPMHLTPLFGLDTVRVGAVAGAGARVVARRAPDIVLALDVTGSMDAAELAQERVAAQALLDCVHDRSTGDSRIGIVLFTGVDTVRTDMLEVGADYTSLSAYIAGIRGCGTTGMPECTGTNQAAGMGGALAMLAGAGTPEGVGQAVLVESDGEPNPDDICRSANYTSVGWRPELRRLCAELISTGTICMGSGRRRTCTTGTVQGQPSLADYQAWADAYVAQAEATPVDIYTVYYGSDAAGIAYMETHVAAGAGFSLQAPTAAEMGGAFEEICQSYTSSKAGMLF